MINTNDLSGWCNDVVKKLKILADRTLEVMNEEISISMPIAYKEFGDYQEKVIRDVFNDAVTEFYNAYTPKYYSRQGNVSSQTGGLYEVLDIKKDDQGMVITDSVGYDDLYNPQKLHKDRHGGDLFNNVFMLGYHGGASSIDADKTSIWGAHPNQGTPYYRKSGLIKYPGASHKTWHLYGKWGRKAERTDSPYEIIRTRLSSLEDSEMFDEFKRLSQKYNDEAMQRVYDKIPELNKEIFG